MSQLTKTEAALFATLLMIAATMLFAVAVAVVVVSNGAALALLPLAFVWWLLYQFLRSEEDEA